MTSQIRFPKNVINLTNATLVERQNLSVEKSARLPYL